MNGYKCKLKTYEINIKMNKKGYYIGETGGEKAYICNSFLRQQQQEN